MSVLPFADTAPASRLLRRVGLADVDDDDRDDLALGDGVPKAEVHEPVGLDTHPCWMWCDLPRVHGTGPGTIRGSEPMGRVQFGQQEATLTIKKTATVPPLPRYAQAELIPSSETPLFHPDGMDDPVGHESLCFWANLGQ